MQKVLISVFLTAFAVLFLQSAMRQSVALALLGMLMAALAAYFS